MNNTEFLILVLVLYLVCFSTIFSTNPRIKTKVGEIEGITETTVGGREYNSFLSIPYALPPTGSLRFKDPEPANTWEGVLNARKAPDYCIQKSGVQERLRNNPFVGSEDCLYLNVYVPKNKGRLPVMVFLHGGAFYRGAAKEYGASTLLDEDVILVIPQYRLGVFGFLSTGNSKISGNFGLKDQNLALKWVKDNIESFGGDPNMVTLFGQSAGAAAVHYHIMSSWSKGLFNRAIMQSGSALCPWAQTTHHREFATSLGDKFGCQIDSTTYLDCIQQINAFEMLIYASSFTKFYISPNWFTPRVDGNFIPESVEEAIRRGLPEIDIIAGVVRDEGAAALGSLDILEKDFKNLLPTALIVEGEDTPEYLSGNIFEKYFGAKKISGQAKEEFVQMIGDRYFHTCHQMFAEFYSRRQNSKLFLYEFTYKPKVSFFDGIDTSLKKWIPHAEELGLLFNGNGIFSYNLTNEHDLKMRKLLSKLWTNFAKYGKPTPDDSMGFVWQRTSLPMDHLNLNIVPRMEHNNRKEITAFWMSLPLEQNLLLFENNAIHNDIIHDNSINYDSVHDNSIHHKSEL